MRELFKGLRTFSRAGLAAALLLCCALAVPAQTNKGGLAGTVKDPSGAVIPNATVRITNQGTGAA
jgi:hypothetical protein